MKLGTRVTCNAGAGTVGRHGRKRDRDAMPAGYVLVNLDDGAALCVHVDNLTEQDR